MASCELKEQEVLILLNELAAKGIKIKIIVPTKRLLIKIINKSYKTKV